MLSTIYNSMRVSVLPSLTTRAFCTGGSGERIRGITKWFNNEKGYGYITPDDGADDVFVHQSEIHAPGFRSLNEGSVVEYELVVNEAIGKTKAVKVTGPNGDYVETQPRRQRNDFVEFQD